MFLLINCQAEEHFLELTEPWEMFACQIYNTPHIRTGPAFQTPVDL